MDGPPDLTVIPIQVMKFQPLLLFSLLFLITCPAPAAAQDYSPEGLKTDVARQEYLAGLAEAHQELRKLSEPILREYSYGSPEHQQLQAETRERDAALLAGMQEYLDLYGFPTRDREKEAEALAMRQAFFRAYQELPKKDSTSIDSLARTLNYDLSKIRTTLDYRGTVLLILGVDSDFNSRCSIIAYLRPEYEAGEISLLSMLTYLRHTYRIRNGQELDIAPGTTEPERLAMYARELSGCW